MAFLEELKLVIVSVKPETEKKILEWILRIILEMKLTFCYNFRILWLTYPVEGFGNIDYVRVEAI